jgi:hypothetical protein
VLFVAARARGMRASTLLVASDNAASGSYAVAEPLAAGLAAAIDIVLAAAASL